MHAAGQRSRQTTARNARNKVCDRKIANGPASGDPTDALRKFTKKPLTGTARQLPGDQVVQALERALGSPEFKSAPQLRSFLKFVVLAKLEHRDEKLKGYVIAVEALGRPKDFNPVLDPIVRVEAARLRRRLARYYNGSGASDPVQITIPKGSYAPSFRLASPDNLSDWNDETASRQDVPLADRPAQKADSTGSQHNYSVANEAGTPSLKGPVQGSIPAPMTLYVRIKGLARRSTHARISVPAAIALCAACFFTGYLVASN